jgi:hypothetical protein
MRKNAPLTKPGIPLKDFAKMTGEERLKLLGITRETVVECMREVIQKSTAEKEAHQNAAAVR